MATPLTSHLLPSLTSYLLAHARYSPPAAVPATSPQNGALGRAWCRIKLFQSGDPVPVGLLGFQFGGPGLFRTCSGKTPARLFQIPRQRPIH
jgi:hypothetical protein